jgi:hypothetical protein
MFTPTLFALDPKLAQQSRPIPNCRAASSSPYREKAMKTGQAAFEPPLCGSHQEPTRYNGCCLESGRRDGSRDVTLPVIISSSPIVEALRADPQA